MARRTKSKKSKARRSYSKKKSKKRVYSSIKTDNTSYGNKKIKSNKKTKKKKLSPNMANKVAKLEKQMKDLAPNKSTGVVFYQEPISMVGGTLRTQKNIYQLSLIDQAAIEACLQEASGSAPLANEKQKLDYGKIRLFLKNCDEGVCTIRIRFLQCIDNTDSDPMALIVQRLTDRGLATGTGFTETPAVVGTNSYSPGGRYFNNSALVVPAINQNGIADYYKTLGKVITVSLNSGDTYTASCSVKPFTYSIDDYSPSPGTYKKNLNYFVLIEVMGDIGHRTGAFAHTSTSTWTVNGFYDYTLKSSLLDNKGAKNMSYTSGWDASGAPATTSVYQNPVSGVATL